MKLTKNIKLFAALTAVSTATLLVAQGSASAIDIRLGGTAVAGEGIKTSVPGATTIDLNNGFPTTGDVTFTGYNSTSLVTGTGGGHAPPAGDNSQYLTIVPTNSPTNYSGNTGSVMINFAKAINYFGLYWGSADGYQPSDNQIPFLAKAINYIGLHWGSADDYNQNQISFYKDAKLLGNYDVGYLAKQFSGSVDGSGSQNSPQANFYANFFAGRGQAFTSVKLSATGPGFQSDNYAYIEALHEPMTDPHPTGSVQSGSGYAYSDPDGPEPMTTAGLALGIERGPEPTTMTGLALGVGAMVSARRRKAQKA